MWARHAAYIQDNRRSKKNGLDAKKRQIRECEMVRRADEIAAVMSVFKEISGSTAGFPSKYIASLGNCNFKTYAEIKVPRLCSRYCIRKRTHARTFHIIYWVVGIFLITPVTQMHTYDELGYLK